jgi:phosphoribosylanthranilate isomerase
VTVRVKICGVRSVEVAIAAAEAGADLLGFNFAPISKRRVDAGIAREAVQTLRARAELPAAAGVFVNQPLDEVARISREVALAYVQLSGDEDAAYCRALAAETGLPVIKAVRLSGPEDGARAHDFHRESAAHALLADTPRAPAESAWGGSGVTWRWGDAAQLAARVPLLLAGGLSSENVAEAIAAVRPWGVDVASGIETDAQTDPIKVRAFIARAKTATEKTLAGASAGTSKGMSKGTNDGHNH